MLQVQLCYLKYAWNLKDKLNHQISLHLLRNERKLSNARMMPDSMCQSQSVATTHLGIRLVTSCEIKQLEWVTNPLCFWCQAGTVDNAYNAIMENNPVWLLEKTKKSELLLKRTPCKTTLPQLFLLLLHFYKGFDYIVVYNPIWQTWKLSSTIQKASMLMDMARSRVWHCQNVFHEFNYLVS